MRRRGTVHQCAAVCCSVGDQGRCSEPAGARGNASLRSLGKASLASDPRRCSTFVVPRRSNGACRFGTAVCGHAAGGLQHSSKRITGGGHEHWILVQKARRTTSIALARAGALPRLGGRHLGRMRDRDLSHRAERTGGGGGRGGGGGQPTLKQLQAQADAPKTAAALAAAGVPFAFTSGGASPADFVRNAARTVLNCAFRALGWP